MGSCLLGIRFSDKRSLCLKFIKHFNMNIKTVIQRDKDINLDLIDTFLARLNDSVKENNYGQVDKILIGIICVKKEIEHMFPERRTRINAKTKDLEIEITLNYSFVKEASEPDLLLNFSQKVKEKFFEAKNKFPVGIIDSSKLIEDLGRMLDID